MAVYEQTYKAYQGALTPAWSRFLIIPRYAYRDVFRSKLFVAFFAVCFAYPLIASILIYLHHNASAIATLKLNLAELVPINASFFQTFVTVQGTLCFFLNLLVGPPLVSRDLANNALPLYLCRPFSPAEYVLGKMSVLFLLMSAITWIPGLLLFLFQGYLEGAAWMVRESRIAAAMLVGSLVWIVVLALLSQAVSAWVRWRMAASAVLLGLFFIPQVFAEVINRLFFTNLGNLFSLRELMRVVWAGLFGTHVRHYAVSRRMRGELVDMPVWNAWVALSVICLVCLLLLVRKVKAYEVVR